MKLILKNSSKFGNVKIREFIQQRQEQQENIEAANYVYFQQIFAKLHHRYLQDCKTNIHHQQKLRELSLFSQRPSKRIVQYFRRESTSFSEDLTTQTFVALSQAQAISAADNNIELDDKGYQLYYSTEFLNLIEEVKFGFKTKKIGQMNVLLIAEASARMGYIDYELFTYIMIEFHKVLGLDPSAYEKNGHTQRHHQLEKAGYYNPKEEKLREVILKDPQFLKSIEILKQTPSKEQEKIELITNNLELSQQEKTLILELIVELKSTTLNMSKLVGAIISLRKAYHKMVKFSANDSVLRNPALNAELLELEEQMLAAKVIDISDMLNPSFFDSRNYEAQRVEEIVCRILGVQNLNQYQQAFNEPKPPKEVKPNNQQMRARLTNRILKAMTGLALSDRKVYYSNQSRSLVNLKWQKTMLQARGNTWEDLGVSKYFRRVFHDIFCFISQYEATWKQQYGQFPLQIRLSFYQSLMSFGIYDKVYEALQDKQVFTELSVEKLSFQDFEALLNVLNNIGTRVEIKPIENEVLSYLEQTLQNQTLSNVSLSLRFCLDSVNFLIQNYDITEQKIAKIYERYMRHVEVRALAREQDKLRNPEIIEAFRTLASEWPAKYEQSPIYIEYLNREGGDQSKINPFLQSLREIALKVFLKKTQKEAEGQIIFPIPAKDGRKRFFLIANSEDTSVDGLFGTGDFNAFLIRNQRNKGGQICVLPVNKLLKIDYNVPSVFKFQNQEKIKIQFLSIFARAPSFQVKFIENIVNSFNKLQKKLQIEHRVVEQIKLQIQLILRFSEQKSQVFTKEGHLAFLADYAFQLDELNKNILILEDIFVLRWDEKFKEVKKNYFQANTPVDELDLNKKVLWQIEQNKKVQKRNTVFLEIKNILKEGYEFIKAEVSAHYQAASPNPSGINLQGKRQSIQTFASPDANIGKVGIQFLNTEYFNDRTYCEYDDWREFIETKYEIDNLPYEELDAFSKVLAKRFLKNPGQGVSFLPGIQKDKKIQIIKLDRGSLPDQVKPESKQFEYTDQDADMLNQIINLQNFKKELKATKSKEEIIEYILKFNFIKELEEAPISQEIERSLLRREAESYFDFLERKGDKIYEESPYMKYMLKKLGRTDKIKSLLEDRRKLRVKNRFLFKQGRMNREEYYNSIGELEKTIITEMKGLSNKLVDHVEDNLLEGSLKMISTRVYNNTAIQNWFKRGNSYHRELDPDYIRGNGDPDMIMNFKRGRAQYNLKLFSALNNIAKGAELSEKQKKLISEWKQSASKPTSKIFHPNFTNKRLSDLEVDDQTLLKLKGPSLLKTNRNMPLIDLILEFSNFFDDQVISQQQKLIRGFQISKEIGFPKELFQTARNQQFSQLCYEKEQAILSKQSTLSNQQIEQLIKMVQVFKVQGFNQRNRYQQLYYNFPQKIREMNQVDHRNELISEYVRHLDKQFFTNYNPRLINQIKKQGINHLWQEIFQTNSSQIQQQKLREVAIKLCHRLEIAKDKLPPYLGNVILLILANKNTDELTKEHIIATIQKYRVDLNLDSSDFTQLEVIPKEVRLEEISSQLELIGNKNISMALQQKMELLL